MSWADILATAGVSILLAAFILHTRNLLAADKKWYNTLNVIGAALCGYSAFLISFYPFVVLETVGTGCGLCFNSKCFTWNTERQ